MTYKHIIDGVDVVECPHRKKEVTFMNVIKCYNYGACEGVNCLYKQFKRKEQECEELIKQRDKFEYGNNILEHERNKYKQALDEVKEYCNRYSTNSIGFKQCILDIISKTEE